MPGALPRCEFLRANIASCDRVRVRVRAYAHICVHARRGDAIPSFFRPALDSTHDHGPQRPRRPAPVWQRRERHRFRSATATARLPPGRHDTRSRAGRATVSPQ